MFDKVIWVDAWPEAKVHALRVISHKILKRQRSPNLYRDQMLGSVEALDEDLVVVFFHCLIWALYF